MKKLLVLGLAGLALSATSVADESIPAASNRTGDATTISVDTNEGVTREIARRKKHRRKKHRRHHRRHR